MKKGSLVVEGAGSLTFSNRNLLLSVFGVPLLLNLVLNVSFFWFPLIFLITALPTFATYNLISCQYATPIRPSSLPNLPLSHYLILNKNLPFTSKIPMETFFEAYFDQLIHLPENLSMIELLENRHDWASFTFTWSQVKFFLTQWIPETLWHSKIQDENQVRDHYDRGDDFYSWFLGPAMVYTSGIITDVSKNESLEVLQQNKIDLVLKKINLKESDRMLDIGCGWGTLAANAAKKCSEVVGVTLGRNQTEFGMNRAREYNVGEKVKILCMDYRDIPPQKFDKITCLEMAEHVGVRNFQTFLLQVRELLNDDGIFFLQIAGLRRAWQYEDLIWGLFMAKYVFPGADASAPLNWVLEQLERAGFEIAHTDTIGVHYSATIYEWYLNWMKNKEKVIENYGVRWFRVWEIFLAWSTIIARQGSATCYQIVAHKNLNAFDRNQFITNRLNADVAY